MTSLFERYKRWRHGRGFGVHSPLAYSLVCNVVQEHTGYDYYGYTYIHDCLNNSSMPMRRQRRRARMLHRLAARFAHSSTAVLTSLPAAWAEALDSAKTMPDGEYEIVVALRPEGKCVEHLKQSARRNCSILIVFEVSEDTLQQLLAEVNHGVILRDKDACLVVVRSDIECVSYNIRL